MKLTNLFKRHWLRLIEILLMVMWATVCLLMYYKKLSLSISLAGPVWLYIAVFLAALAIMSALSLYFNAKTEATEKPSCGGNCKCNSK